MQALGAELHYFSPLADHELPQVDSLYLPGGYPELYLAELEGNQLMAAAIRAHHQAGKPLLAECGGMLYLLDELRDKQGASGRMLGLLAGSAALQPRLTALALQQVTLPEGELRGHSYHHSRLESPLQPLVLGRWLRRFIAWGDSRPAISTFTYRPTRRRPPRCYVHERACLQR